MSVKVYRNGTWEEVATKSDKAEIKYTGLAATNVFSLIAALNPTYWRLYNNDNNCIVISEDRKILAFHMGFIPCQSNMEISTTDGSGSARVFTTKNNAVLGDIITSKVDFFYRTYDNIWGINMQHNYIELRSQNRTEFLKNCDPFYLDCIVYKPNQFLFTNVPEIYNVW